MKRSKKIRKLKDKIAGLELDMKGLTVIAANQKKWVQEVVTLLKKNFGLPPESMMDLIVKADNSSVKLAPNIELGGITISGDNCLLDARAGTTLNGPGLADQALKQTELHISEINATSMLQNDPEGIYIAEDGFVSDNEDASFTEKLNNTISFEMIAISKGEFAIKDKNKEKEWAQKVRLSSFHLAEFPVTQELWDALSGKDNNPSHFKGPKRPVENVNYDDIQMFLKRLNRATNKSYCLPTECQWEYAAGCYGLGGEQPCDYSGDDILDDVGWYKDNSDGETHEVGLKSANILGLFDMSGNVWEWCQDWYKKGYFRKAKEEYMEDPQGPEKGERRSIRGGSWRNPGVGCRSAVRSGGWPGSRVISVGFRLALNIK